MVARRRPRNLPGEISLASERGTPTSAAREVSRGRSSERRGQDGRRNAARRELEDLGDVKGRTKESERPRVSNEPCARRLDNESCLSGERVKPQVLRAVAKLVRRRTETDAQVPTT